MSNKKIIYTVESIDTVVQEIKSLLNNYSIFTFTGTLGAGKTTLIQALLASCGITDSVVSPTFTYVNIYHNIHQQIFYHFDCYRITSLNNFIAAGFDEYLYKQNSWTFIEWPEYIMPLLDRRVCHIILDYQEDLNTRVITLHSVE